MMCEHLNRHCAYITEIRAERRNEHGTSVKGRCSKTGIECTNYCYNTEHFKDALELGDSFSFSEKKELAIKKWEALRDFDGEVGDISETSPEQLILLHFPELYEKLHCFTAMCPLCHEYARQGMDYKCEGCIMFERTGIKCARFHSPYFDFENNLKNKEKRRKYAQNIIDIIEEWGK
jgi:hypothetical protein